MKVALPVALLAFALGCLAGLFIERHRNAPAPAITASNDPASTPVAADSSDLKSKLEAAEKRAQEAETRVASLEKKKKKDPAAGPDGKPLEPKKVLTPEEALARAAELNSRIPDLVAKKDGKALMKLMHELAELGEAGYLGAIEISGLLYESVADGKSTLGISQTEFYKSFSGPMVPVMVWGLQNPDAPSGFRAGAVWSLPWAKDVDAGKLFLDVLKLEKDPSVIGAITRNLEGLAKPEMTAELSALIRDRTDSPQILQSSMDALYRIGTPEAIASLEVFARDSNPAIRSEAEIALIAARPPAAGVMITTALPDSQASNVGIKRGDILTGYNGAPISSLDDLRDQIGKSSADSVVTITVNRKGEIIPLQIKGGQKLGIDGKAVAPK